MTDAVATTSDAEALQAQLAALRADGACRADPIRFHALEKLAARIAGQPAPVQQLLQARLLVALQELAARGEPVPLRVTPPKRLAAKGGPLSALAAPAHSPELSSVLRFRETWARSQAVDRVAQALARKPRNAGPLNSHALVLQTFSLLQAASPAYLRRVVDVVEALHWLERATEAPAAGTRKAKKRG